MRNKRFHKWGDKIKFMWKNFARMLHILYGKGQQRNMIELYIIPFSKSAQEVDNLRAMHENYKVYWISIEKGCYIFHGRVQDVRRLSETRFLWFFVFVIVEAYVCLLSKENPFARTRLPFIWVSRLGRWEKCSVRKKQLSTIVTVGRQRGFAVTVKHEGCIPTLWPFSLLCRLNSAIRGAY